MIGAAEACFHQALDYTMERKQFGRPLAANQLIQTKFANMATDITLALHAVHRLSQLKDAGKIAPEMISMLKRNNT